MTINHYLIQYLILRRLKRCRLLPTYISEVIIVLQSENRANDLC